MAKKIAWGILGAARIAKNQMVPAIRMTSDGEVMAIASRDKERAAAFARSLGIPKAYWGYEQLLSDPDIDAIYIALPTGSHCEWSIKAAEAGKAVLCEKPISTNADEAKKIGEIFSSRQILVAESLMYKYHPLTRKVKELISSRKIGKPKLIHSLFVTSPPKDDIRFSKEAGGGALLDLGCYCTSFARLIASNEPKLISAVGNIDENGVDLAVGANLLFPSGIIAHLSCSFNAAFDCRYMIWGEKGTLSVDRGALCAWPGEEFIIKIYRDGKTENIKVPEANPYKLIADDFQKVLLGKKDKMDYIFDDCVANMQTLDIIRSYIESEQKK